MATSITVVPQRRREIASIKQQFEDDTAHRLEPIYVISDFLALGEAVLRVLGPG